MLAGKTQHKRGSEHNTAKKILAFMKVEKVRKLSATKHFSIKYNSLSLKDPRLCNILRMWVHAYGIHNRMRAF